MRKTTIATITGAAFLAGGLLAAPNLAGAGHQGPFLEAELDGRSEVASNAKSNKIVGDPNGSGEAYVFTTNEGATLCYVVEVSKIEPATAMHIHEAAAGQNGPVVLTLGAPTAGYSAACTTPEDASLVSEITSSPEDYYVNVHNAEYPGGALRGQLGSAAG